MLIRTGEYVYCIDGDHQYRVQVTDVSKKHPVVVMLGEVAIERISKEPWPDAELRATSGMANESPYDYLNRKMEEAMKFTGG